MGTPEDPILRLAEEWPAQKEQMLAERQKRLNELNAKKEGIKTMPVPADVRDPDAWRQARVRSVNEKIDQVKEDIERIEERNPIHMPVQRGTFKETAEARERAGFPREGLAKTEIGKGWEALTDSMIHSIEAGKLRDPYYMADLESRAYDNSRGIAGAPPVSLEDIYLDRRFGKYGKLHYHKEMMSQNPWLSKVDPSTLIYKTDLQFGGGMPLDRSLGFDHVMDVLRRDIEAGRIRPEQLSKMSMEQAVRRTADYDAEKAVQMKKATAEEAKNLTPHMDFDDGYRIVRLDKPGQFAKESQRMAHSVEGYEPPINHPDYVEASNNAGSQYYGHGGWEAIKSGKAQVFSLRDEKGMPHVTIELGPETWPKGGPVQAFDAIGKKYTEAMDEAMARIGITNGKFPEGTTEEQRNQIQKNFDNTLKDIFIESGGKMTNPITQIKGKRNETPDEEYMPYVQKFIREGNYDIAGDLQNSGLIDTLGRNRPAFLPPDAPRYVTKEELDRMTKTGKFEPDFNRGGEVHMAGAGDVAKALAKVAKTAKKAGALSAVEAAPQEGRLLDIMSARVAPATTPRGTGLPLLPRSQGMYTPDVPQVDLPRQKGRGGKYTERMQALLDSPTARKKVNELIEKGEQLGMREWYGTEPLRQAAMDAGLSPEKFNELMAQLASASQRNPVDKQNQMGSYLWHLSQTGQLPEDAFLLTSRIKKNPLLAPPGTPVEFPKGLGSLAQTAIFERGRDIAHGNIEDVLPPTAKLGTFYRNLLGNLQPVTVDVNAVRGPVIAVKDPRWLTSKLVEKDEEGNVINTYFPRKMVESGEMTAKQAAERPGFWEAAPEGSEYKGFEELWQRAAKRHDIAPAEAQALGWYGSGDITALKTKPELYIDNLERLIRRTADQTGKAPTEVLNDFLTGKGFLYKEGGFATTKVKKRSKNG